MATTDLRGTGSGEVVPTSSDYVVVGAGLAGAATAWHLAAAGHDVTVLERGEPADPAGSSHGSARILRYAYPDPFYVRLVRESRAWWDLLESESGVELVRRTGSLDFGEVRHPRRLAAVLAAAGVEHELLPRQDASARWEQLRFDSEVLWHPSAGVIDAEQGVHAMLGLATAHGARVRSGWDVVSAVRHGAGYVLDGADGSRHSAGRVVVAAGGWLPGLLGSLDLRPDFLAALPRLEVLQEQAFHFPYRDPVPAWPTFIHKSREIRTYSLPGGRDAGWRGQKLAQYRGGRSIGSAGAQDGTVDPVNRARMVSYVARHLPGLVPEPYAETTCLFTNTPTEDFLVDRCDGVTLVSACSGHGAKFAPLVGRMAAELASAASAGTGRAAVPAAFRTTPGDRTPVTA